MRVGLLLVVWLALATVGVWAQSLAEPATAPSQAAPAEIPAAPAQSVPEKSLPDGSPAEKSLPEKSVPETRDTDAVREPAIELTPDASGAVPVEQIRKLLERAEEKDLENNKQERNYTYVERVVQRSLDSHGGVKKVETRTSEVLQIYGEDVERLTARDDKPLSEKDKQKEDEKIQKIIDKRKNESEGDRRKRLEKEEKNREEDRKFVLEIADAFNFRLVGAEAIAGRDAWVLAGTPRPGYQPKHKNAQIMTKFAGRVWIDKADAQWVKVDVTAIDTVTFGLVLARIHKGTHFVVELTRVNDEVWLPKYLQLHFDARLALLKNFYVDVDQTYSDYKKFGSDSRITVLGETQ